MPKKVNRSDRESSDTQLSKPRKKVPPPQKRKGDKILSSKGKLTTRSIDKLTVYYGLAIRGNHVFRT